MKKKLKQFLICSLTLVLFLSIMPLTASAQTSGKCGDYLTWTLNSKGSLSISGTGSMYNWTNYTNVPWYDVSSTITSVYIGKDITNIGDYAFAWCPNIKDVIIGGSVGEIGYCAFSGCTSLSRVSIPSSVYKIYDTAFDECRSLGYIYVDINNSYYSSDSKEVLYNKDKTVLVKYPSGNTRTSYDIPEGVVTIGRDAFDGCFSLTKLTIPQSITTIEYSSFNYCPNLKDVHYKGPKNKWENVYVNSHNEDLLDAEFHFNCITHEYETEITIPATHTTTGVKTYTCSCGDTYTETIAKIEKHNHNAVVTAPTCTEQGYTTYTCECGDSYVDDYISPKWHIFTNYVYNNDATEYLDGTKTAYCDYGCGTTYTIKEIGTAKNPTIIDIYPGQTKKCILGFGTAVIFRINSMEDIEEGYWFSLKYPKELTPPFDPNNYFENLPIKWNDYYDEIKYGTLYGGMGDCLEGEEYFSPHISKAGQIYYIEVISQHDESIEISLSMSGSCKPEYPTDAHTLGEWVVTKPATTTQTGVKTQNCSVCGAVLETETIPVTVVKGKVHSVAISDVSLDYKASTTITPSITVDSGVKYTVTYSSSNPSVASVDTNGKVSTGKTGSATITVTVTDEFGNTVTDTCEVKVSYNWWQWIIVIVLFGWIWY